MSNETFTIQLQPIAGGFQVTIPELGIVLEVQSTKHDDALNAANDAIIDALQAREALETAKAS